MPILSFQASKLTAILAASNYAERGVFSAQELPTIKNEKINPFVPKVKILFIFIYYYNNLL